MSAFLTKLWLEDVDGTNWIVAAPFRYESDLLRGIVVVPTGFVTDLASVPRVFQGILPASGPYNKASVLHDSAYFGQLVTRDGQRIHLVKSLADLLFREAMLLSGVNPLLAEHMYQLVVAFGKTPETGARINGSSGD